ncbi:hypothetical protein ACHAWF_013311 [Thalassiosira exigua]
MSDHNDNTGLVVVFVLYMAVLVGAGLWGWWNQRRRMKDAKAHDTAEEELTSQFLAGRSLGPFVTSMTMLASSFSGFTVVGIPNEAFALGFTSLKWVALQLPVQIMWSGAGLRMRKASLVRNHQSPVDFVTDRFRSQVLRYTVVFHQVLPEILYLVVQLSSIKQSFNTIFNIPASNPAPVILVSAVILSFEWLGGMSCVAYTDAIQAVCLIGIMFIFPIVFSTTFGGWVNLDPMTYPRPDFYSTPDAESQMIMFTTVFVAGVSSYSLPHYIQRVYAAENVRALKLGWAMGSVAPWALNLTGVYIGTMGVSVLAGKDTVPANAFGDIVNSFMDASMAGYVIGSFVFVAGMAAIMSTADSILIAIAQLITTEIAYPMRPNSNPHQINIIGKAVSFGTMSVSLLLTLLWQDGLSAIFSIIFAVSAQATPTLIVGLFATPERKAMQLHPWALAAGAWTATICLVSYYFSPDYKAQNLAFSIEPGFVGLLVNLGFLLIYSVVTRLIGPCQMQPAWDKPPLARFGECELDAKMMLKMMHGIKEPFLEGYFLPLVLLLMIVAVPLTGNGMPPLEENGQLAYMPNLVAGLPDWAFAYVIFTALLTALALYYIYRIPDTVEGTQEGEIDPNILILAKEILNFRKGYDTTNEKAFLFRSRYMPTKVEDCSSNHSGSDDDVNDATPDPDEEVVETAKVEVPTGSVS